MRRLIPLLILAVTACGGDSADDETPQGGDGDSGDGGAAWGEESLDLITSKSGAYGGAWEMMGLDASGATYTAMTWTDEVTSSDPRIEGDRAIVDVYSFMVIDPYGEYELSWIEGVFIEEDGSAGEEFMEMDGEITIFTKVADDRYEYETAVGQDDYYYWDGPTAQNLISGHHVNTKIVSYPDGVETHDITRFTTLEWDDGGGVQVAEFTSMMGQHYRVK